jgi:serine/threonine protein kinase
MKPDKALSKLNQTSVLLASKTLPITRLDKDIKSIVMIEQHLGKGNYGDVYRGHIVKTDQPIAIKRVNIIKHDKPHFIRAEIESLYHAMNGGCTPYVCEIYDVLFDSVNQLLFFIMEYLDGESLEELILDTDVASDQDLMPIITPLALGLKCLHDNGIAHRDIKPENIMLTEQGPKWIDFGLSCFQNCDESPGVGNLATIAPEILANPTKQPKTLEEWKQADLWSFGCVVYETITTETLPTQINFVLAFKANPKQFQVDLEAPINGLEVISSDKFPQSLDVLRGCLVLKHLQIVT